MFRSRRFFLARRPRTLVSHMRRNNSFETRLWQRKGMSFMYEIYKEVIFAGAHRLREYEGKCESLHGHNWRVRACLKADVLDDLGMVLDFKILNQALREVLDGFDHSFLNEVPPFDELNPTAENIAKVVFDQLSLRLNDDRVAVSSVEVFESDGARAVYGS